MFLSKSQSNFSSSSHLFSLTNSQTSDQFVNRASFKLTKQDYKKFMSKLAKLFHSDPQNLDGLYLKIQEQVNSGQIQEISDENIYEMVQIVNKLKDNNNMLQNLVTVLNKREKDKEKRKIKERKQLQKSSFMQIVNEENSRTSGEESTLSSVNYRSKNQFFKQKIKRILNNVEDIKHKLNEKEQLQTSLNVNAGCDSPQKQQYGAEEKCQKSEIKQRKRSAILEDLERKNKRLNTCFERVQRYIQNQSYKKLSLEEIDRQNGRRDTLVSLNIDQHDEIAEKEEQYSSSLLQNCKRVQSKTQISGRKKLNNNTSIEAIQAKVQSLCKMIQPINSHDNTPKNADQVQNTQKTTVDSEVQVNMKYSVEASPIVELQRTIPRKIVHTSFYSNSSTPKKQIISQDNMNLRQFTPAKHRQNNQNLTVKPIVKFSHVQPHLPPRVHKKVLLPQQMQFRKLEQSFQDPRALNVSHNFEGKRREHSRRSSSGIRVYSKEKRF